MRETLSIIIPCYNEGRTISQLLRRVLRVQFAQYEKEIIVVDDGSRDDTTAQVQALMAAYPQLRLLQQPHNMGKGAAVRRGFAAATGALVVVQDADLEYDPEDLQQLLALFRLPQVMAVFGSRRLLPGHLGSGALYYWGAQAINLTTNLLYGVWLSDQFTCYKMLRREVLEHLPLRSNGFAIDAELVAKLLRRSIRIFEVPITYQPRTRQQGKKIRVQDGWHWLWQIIKYRLYPLRG